jgi:hypothetical protein
MAIKMGTPGDDSLSGTDGDDVIVGGKGDDTLEGGTGSDKLLGGQGDDTFIYDLSAHLGTDSEDAYHGGSGSDHVIIRLTQDEADIYQQVLQDAFDENAGNSRAINLADYTQNLAGGPINLTIQNIENIEFDVIPSVNVVYVDLDAAGGNNDGSSWEHAFTDLRVALNFANNFPDEVDQIWVAEGTYTPGQLRTDTFSLVDGVEIYGGFDATETSLDQRDFTAHETILSGDIGSGGNSYHVVVGASNATIDGFTICDGYADGFGILGNGGGMLNTNVTNLDVANNRFVGNYAATAGGAIDMDNADVNISSCFFEGNTNTVASYSDSSGTMTNNVFTDNLGDSVVANISGDFDIVNNTFAENTAINTIYNEAVLDVHNNILWDDPGSYLIYNGGPYGYGGTINLTYNDIKGGVSSVFGVSPYDSSNVNVDPSFADAASDDFSLASDSALIDAGNNTTVSVPETDILGNERVIDVGDPDIDAGAVDMGAYEFIPEILIVNSDAANNTGDIV